MNHLSKHIEGLMMIRHQVQFIVISGNMHLPCNAALALKNLSSFINLHALIQGVTKNRTPAGV